MSRKLRDSGISPPSSDSSTSISVKVRENCSTESISIESKSICILVSESCPILNTPENSLSFSMMSTQLLGSCSNLSANRIVVTPKSFSWLRRYFATGIPSKSSGVDTNTR